MTPQEWSAATVRIATELLGWEVVRQWSNSWGLKRGGSNSTIWIDGSWTGDDDFPRFSTRDGCAEFERALVEREDLIRQYCVELTLFSGAEPEPGNEWAGIAMACLYATPEQRVKACLAVLDARGAA